MKKIDIVLAEVCAKKLHEDEVTSSSPPHSHTFCPHPHRYVDEYNCC